ncbi:MAG: hypothetical protein WB662_06775, partial [Methyloceanibacter sp.]
MSEFRARPLLFCLVAVLPLTLVAVLGARADLSGGGDAGLKPPSPAVLAGVTSNTDQAADAPPTAYVWSATRSGSMLTLRGFVPSEEDHRTVLGMVKAHFADLEVEDRLKVTQGAP